MKFSLIISLLLSISYAQDHVGLWIVRHALLSENDVTKILMLSEQTRVNTLYVQVYALGQAYWDTGYSLESEQVSVSDKILGQLVDLAHKRSMKVYAWMNVFYIWNSKESPANNHIMNLFHNSVIRIDSSEQLPLYTDLKKTGNEGFYIDPADKTYLDRLKLLIKELFFNFKFDGLHLDYFRYPNGTFIHSVTGRTKYNLQYYLDPIELSDKTNFISSYSPDIYNDSMLNYKNFLHGNIREFLMEISTVFKSGQEIISLAVKPNRSIASNTYYQDWKSWLERDLCHQLMLMNYDTDFDQFKRNVKSSLAGNEWNKSIIVGISVYNQKPEEVKKRIDFLREIPVGGYSYFSYNYFNENPAYTSRFLELLFPK